MDLSYDNSFVNSLLFCPSVDVEKRVVDINEVFNCDQSTIGDGDNGTYNDDTSYESEKGMITSTVHFSLTKGDLQEFDEDVRRAEC